MKGGFCVKMDDIEEQIRREIKEGALVGEVLRFRELVVDMKDEDAARLYSKAKEDVREALHHYLPGYTRIISRKAARMALG